VAAALGAHVVDELAGFTHLVLGCKAGR